MGGQHQEHERQHEQAPDLRGSLLPEGRISFICERFDRLKNIEQSLIIAHVVSVDESLSASESLHLAHEVHTRWSSAKRENTFRELIARRPEHLDSTTELLIQQHEKYLPALVSAMIAIYKGDDIGLLTARGARRNHQLLIDAIQDFLGVQIPRCNMYFVNDVDRNSRLGNTRTADKKFQILMDFATGHYQDAEGTMRPMSRSYDEVIFYDDEHLNIETTNRMALEKGFEGRIRAVDAAHLDRDELWDELMELVDAGPPKPMGSTGTIHFYDIDGTLVQVHALMSVRAKGEDNPIILITQEEFAESGGDVPGWIQKALEVRPDLTEDDVYYDFDDFRDPDRVRAQVTDDMFRDTPNPHRPEQDEAA